MKNLIDYISESLMIFESTESTESSKSLFEIKTQEAADIRYKMKEFFNTTQDCLKPNNKGKKKSVDNENERTIIYRGLVEYLCMGRTKELMRSILRKYGLSSELGFRNFILSNGKYFEKEKWNMKWCLQYDLTALEAEFKRAQAAGEIPDAIDDEDAQERDLVIYDRWNPEDHRIYPFTGKRGKKTDSKVNNLRMEFRHETGVKYYDCYPILWKNYDGHVEELKKRAELQLGYDDPNEFK